VPEKKTICKSMFRGKKVGERAGEGEREGKNEKKLIRKGRTNWGCQIHSLVTQEKGSLRGKTELGRLRRNKGT